MKVFRGLPNAEAKAPCALTIGNFDGVHRGHQALLARLRAAANQLHVEAAVMTFEPHPREFFAQVSGGTVQAPTRIANLRDKLESLADNGVDRVIVEHFNAHFAAMPPHDFIEKVLVQGMHVKWLMVGEDFCFGAKRAGNVAMLKQAGDRFGFHVETLPTVTVGDERISSSAIRAALAQGDFQQVEQLLGHSYAISGHVVHGNKLGHTIGFPTMNLRVAHNRPALSGIFAVQVHGLSAPPLAAVASLGTRPTIDDSGRTLLEVHALADLPSCYGKLIRVVFLQKLRDEKKFTDLASLTAAIARDVEQTRAYFKKTSESFAVSATDRI